MDDRTRATFETLSERLAGTARQLGELTLAYERLAHRRSAPDEAPPEPVPADAGQPHGDGPAPADEVTRQDRIAYLETARGALYRLLFVVDFTLAHDRVDRALLADARRSLVEGVDAADACLMLDGAGPEGVPARE